MKSIPLHAGMCDEYFDDKPYDHMEDDDNDNEMEIWLDEDLGVYLRADGTITPYFVH